jgi:hypothetical protein
MLIYLRLISLELFLTLCLSSTLLGCLENMDSAPRLVSTWYQPAEMRYVDRSRSNLTEFGATASTSPLSPAFVSAVALVSRPRWPTRQSWMASSGTVPLFAIPQRHSPLLTHRPMRSRGSGGLNVPRYIFWVAPHIGLTLEGEVGKVYRPGREAASSACGAMIAVHNELRSGRLNISLDPLDLEQVSLNSPEPPSPLDITLPRPPSIPMLSLPSTHHRAATRRRTSNRARARRRRARQTRAPSPRAADACAVAARGSRC